MFEMRKYNQDEDLQAAIKHYAKAMKLTEAEAREDAAAMIKDSLKDNADWTDDFAVASWIEDTMDMSIEEAAELEAKGKAATKHNAKSQAAIDAFGKKHERVRKPNEAKRELVNLISNALTSSDIDNAITNVERQVDFIFEGVSYSITLTAHRAPKANKEG